MMQSNISTRKQQQQQDHHHHYPTNLFQNLRLLTLTILFIIGHEQNQNNFTTQALKHSFVTKHDARPFIGPMGIPFGFLTGGVFNLTVYDFDLEAHIPIGMLNKKNKKNKNKKKKRKNKKELEQQEQEIKEKEELIKKEVHAGFVLKRFKNEAEFARFEDSILESFENEDGFVGDDLPACIFEENVKATTVDDGSDDDDDDDGGSRRQLSTATDTSDDGSSNVAFLSMKDPTTWDGTPYVTHTFTSDQEGFYFLCYQVCYIPSSSTATTTSNKNTNDDAVSLEELVKKSILKKRILSTFELDITNKNFDVIGRPSYLTAGDVPLPLLFLYFSISYGLLLYFWWNNVVKKVSKGSSGGAGGGSSGSEGGASHVSAKQNVHAIHHLMSAVLLLKTITVFFESVRYHYIQHKGHAELLSFVYYTFSFLKGMFLFTVVLLIGSGWSFFKPFLNAKEKKIILFVIILQVIDNIIIVILSQEVEGEQWYDDWSAVLHLVDIICCCSILVPIVWQVNSLEQSVEESKGGDDGDGAEGSKEENDRSSSSNAETQRILSKLQLFRSFYVLVVAYIYFTRIVVYLVASKLNYKHDWIKYLLTELGTLAFYVIVGIKFRPMEENKYAPLDGKDDDEEEEVILDVKRTVGSIEMSEVNKTSAVV